MSETVLGVEHLRVERDTVILDDINWQMRRGEHWVVLGANGSGKTSLLSVLTGYLTPTSGRVAVGDKVYGEADWRDVRTRIGLVSGSIRRLIRPEETGLEVVVSGKDAVLNYWGEITPELDARARAILADIGCDYAADRRWAVLSEGERQRCLIGRALMAGYDVLILDEPCSGLDPVAREHFLQFIEELARRPDAPGIVLVTHHVEEITPAFSHVLVLKGGKVLTQGKKADVMTSETLSEAFSADISLLLKDAESAASRYSLRINA